ncbi:helix-turn-helix domain-containing protein [Testudinibacter aquarius]|uniref:Helix-turn-helix protein n=1 Tax=Testudinibacter aquarius TaxID=1524974 RepID=A0A4R3YC60_9PAST|nr:helix-turn-helix transcriptional regulator [Testudinibacter aquarius]KAE9529851.1 transcriptional regulator [Testudinibacter aquarius]TCV89382.1 helix-turn-helix protein [Testudinibacter aquarius]TNG93162.1 helix-turn-helix transcriptional regulator [Testudinibacter aquarius]
MAKFPPTTIDYLIGQRIQQKRKEKGYTAELLSELVDISQPQLSRYERGTNKINVAHLVKIANFLETPISYFFTDCMLDKAWNNDKRDRYWQELSNAQKDIFVAFLDAVRQIKA